MKKLLATLVSKYHLGSDSILLSWILKHPAQVIPIAGTVNVARIQLDESGRIRIRPRRLVCYLDRKYCNDVA
jgi:predicted oxidoreductase